MGTDMEGVLQEISVDRRKDLKRIGLIINPIAGMGGPVGLHGTDNMLGEALARGASPVAEDRAREALACLLPFREELEVLVPGGAMGGRLAAEMGFRTVRISGEDEAESAASAKAAGPAEGESSASAVRSAAEQETDAAAGTARLYATGRADTVRAAAGLLALLPDERPCLVLFAGGDGTAKDIFSGLGTAIPCIGIPAGVKIHSPVYARSPKAAGRIAAGRLSGEISGTREAEVLDIDEEEYRNERISTRLYGYLMVPDDSRRIQNRKEPAPLSDRDAAAAIAADVADNMERGCRYLIGAGTTTRAVMEELGLPCTLIGVDLVQDGRLIASDIYGAEIETAAKSGPARLVVTVTGGQGFLFGRGNQQITPGVLRAVGRKNIIIIITPAKLAELGGRPLLTDTGDHELDKELAGYYRVITGYGQRTICKVETA